MSSNRSHEFFITDGLGGRAGLVRPPVSFPSDNNHIRVIRNDISCVPFPSNVH